jgi:hypothetical protein
MLPEACQTNTFKKLMSASTVSMVNSPIVYQINYIIKKG